VCVNSKVTQLILNADNQVTGAVLAGLGITIKGKRFVLVSGVRFSPQLLMSSGIGNTTSLAALGVKTNVNLPDVGRHFHDEWGFPISFKISSANASAWAFTDSKLNRDQLHLVKWSTGAQGENFTDVQLYLRLGNKLSIDDYLPEFFKIGISGDQHDMFAIRVNMYQNDTFGTTSGVFPVGSNGIYADRFTFRVTMFDNSEKSDRFVSGAVAGYNKAMELIEMMRNQSLNNETLRLEATDSSAVLITAANQGVQPFIEAIWDWANVLALHGAGTCGIGRVVDSDLKVFNVSNLYIGDMSVLPFPVDANPTATLYALGERLAAHLISLPTQPKTSGSPDSSWTNWFPSHKDILIPVGSAIAGIIAGTALHAIIARLKNNEDNSERFVNMY
jgi:choline dehydrogenase-like flavoprotein